MADDFCERYGDLLTGSYDCVDRIVLNAFFPLGHNPGGFRTWWRRWHNGSDDDLDNTHLMRMAGRFARRVKAWGQANGVPVVYCRAGERKHQIAEEPRLRNPPHRHADPLPRPRHHNRSPSRRIDNILSIGEMQVSRPL